eukprot:2489781-Amphidinium_carterae.1
MIDISLKPSLRVVVFVAAVGNRAWGLNHFELDGGDGYCMYMAVGDAFGTTLVPPEETVDVQSHAHTLAQFDPASQMFTSLM